jgi:hypothetical protein
MEEQTDPVDPNSKATTTGDTAPATRDRPGLVQTTVEVLDGEPVLVVAHTAHGCWHLSGHSHLAHVGYLGSAARPGSTVPAAGSWAPLITRDPSLAQVADLPRGWSARRDSPTGSWRRSPA